MSVSSIHPADLADKDCHFQMAVEEERASRRNLQRHIDMIILGFTVSFVVIRYSKIIFALYFFPVRRLLSYRRRQEHAGDRGQRVGAARPALRYLCNTHKNKPILSPFLLAEISPICHPTLKELVRPQVKTHESLSADITNVNKKSGGSS